MEEGPPCITLDSGPESSVFWSTWALARRSEVSIDKTSIMFGKCNGRRALVGPKKPGTTGRVSDGLKNSRPTPLGFAARLDNPTWAGRPDVHWSVKSCVGRRMRRRRLALVSARAEVGGSQRKRQLAGVSAIAQGARFRCQVPAGRASPPHMSSAEAAR